MGRNSIGNRSLFKLQKRRAQGLKNTIIMNTNPTILAIESSCDDTSAAVVRGGELLSSVIASQAVHESWGGVVPELASRAHQLNIVPTVAAALKKANIAPAEIDAIGFTRGPGLLGSLLVGVCFTKGLAISTGAPMIEVNHLTGHILSHFLKLPDKEFRSPSFPFLCLLVSGGHTQIVLVRSYFDMEIVGTTIDDAAGEAFDKCAKVMGLGYPGGPVVDRLAANGDPNRFKFARPNVGELDFSFSGLKTSFLYTIRDACKLDADFVEHNKEDLCASLQHTVVSILVSRLEKAAAKYNISTVAIGGGVSANSGLRSAVAAVGVRHGWDTFIPERFLTTDNAAMIGITAHYKYLQGDFCPLSATPFVN